MLGTLDPCKKENWKSYVSPVVSAYNSTKHESTKVSPAFLMYGRHSRLPIDLILSIPEGEGESSYTKYVSDLRSRLSEVFKIATNEADRARKRQKHNYDLRARGNILEKGDQVLVRILAFRGKHKISNRWEEHAYSIITL